MGLLDKLKGKGGGGGGSKASPQEIAQRARDAGIDPQVIKEILESSRGPDGKVDRDAVVAKAQERGIDVETLKSLFR
jgi:hypothetical protein